MTSNIEFGLTRRVVDERLAHHPNVRLFVGIVHDRDGETHTHVGIELKEARTAGGVEKMLGVPVIVKPYVGQKGDPTAWGLTVKYFLHETADSRDKAHYDMAGVFSSRDFDPASALAALEERDRREVETLARAERLIRTGAIQNRMELADRFTDAFLDKHWKRLDALLKTMWERRALRGLAAKERTRQERIAAKEREQQAAQAAHGDGVAQGLGKQATPSPEHEASGHVETRPSPVASRSELTTALLASNDMATVEALVDRISREWDADDGDLIYGFCIEDLQAELTDGALSNDGLLMAAAWTTDCNVMRHKTLDHNIAEMVALGQ
ncbi:Rep family protein [Acidipropionibacterium timonense]|uniref:Rep family protein n=1 Tax=Acidipropionibacterium timonense TaxID=2161818 RepID=UPI001030EB94|nr:Rep family protein [Acidipropionibacterium timonense]